MDEITFTDPESEYLNRRPDFAYVTIAVTGSNRSGNDRKTWLESAQIPHQAIGQSTGHAQPFVHGRMNLAPPRGDAIGLIRILDNGDCRARARRHRSKIFDTTRAYLV